MCCLWSTRKHTWLNRTKLVYDAGRHSQLAELLKSCFLLELALISKTRHLLNFQRSLVPRFFYSSWQPTVTQLLLKSSLLITCRHSRTHTYTHSCGCVLVVRLTKDFCCLITLDSYCWCLVLLLSFHFTCLMSMSYFSHIYTITGWILCVFTLDFYVCVSVSWV